MLSTGDVTASNRGWQLLRQGNPPDAMRRFNQAWLLNANNGGALWGMAVIQGQMGQLDHALKMRLGRNSCTA